MSNDHVKKLFSRELEEAKSFFEAGRTHLRIARALSKEFGFDLPEGAAAEHFAVQDESVEGTLSPSEERRSQEQSGETRRRRANGKKKIQRCPT